MTLSGTMTVIFISDLHLEEKTSAITEIFLRFLNTLQPNVKALYILGDFFESWIGDDDLTPFNLKIINALKQKTQQGLPIYFLHGNRDFLLGKKFFKATGCILLPDEIVIEIEGNKILLMHGDTLCTEDKAYLKFRKKARNKFIQWLFLWKSLAKRKAIANQYRQASQKYIATAPDHIMDVTQAEVMRVMQKHQVQQLIHGHTHRQAIHEFTLDGKPASRSVLGAWHHEGNGLVYDAGKGHFIVLK